MSVFDEYIKDGNPSQKEKSYAWKIAIGLQDVDGLKPSDYLMQIAKRNIEGDITIEEAKQLIDSYYQSSSNRHDVGYERTEESNKVSATDTDSVQSANSALYLLPKCQNGPLNVTLEESALLEFVKVNPKATQEQIAEHIGKSTRTVKRITAILYEKGCLKRENGKRNGIWTIISK